MMNYEHVANVLCALPSGTEVIITTYNGTYNGMARDYPGMGRRYTVNFAEWFITPEALENLSVTAVKVYEFDL
jgi:hypothetical protein